MERVNLSNIHVCPGQVSRVESLLREALVTTERMGLTSVRTERRKAAARRRGEANVVRARPS